MDNGRPGPELPDSVEANLQISTTPEDAIYGPSSPYTSFTSTPNASQSSLELPKYYSSPLDSYISSSSLESTGYHTNYANTQAHTFHSASSQPSTSSIASDASTTPASSISSSSSIITSPPGFPEAPTLTISPARTEEDLLSALHLIAESIAQQRQLAIKAILLHPAVLAASIFYFLSSIKLLYTGYPSDIVLMLGVWSMSSLISLFIIRRYVQGYSSLIERTNELAWFSEYSIHGLPAKRDEVFVARQGEKDGTNGSEIVGVLVMRICKTVTDAGPPGLRPRSCRRRSSARWTGIIRSWTVKRTSRCQGIGTRLLQEAIANCRLRTLDGPIFADDHALSKRVLPQMFNVIFDKQDGWARTYLEHAIIAQRNK
ncbi:hypothetical protein FQN57_003249 [Myotisia sp. PD_48]|nr:hypothetical protein FQN57_003249 [Myotisia sp. PD_48]